MAERAFIDKDFLRNLKPLLEDYYFVDLVEDDRGPPMNELAGPTQVADIATIMTSMKESSSSPDSLRLYRLRDNSVVTTILCDLLLLKCPLRSRGKTGNIFNSRVTFINFVTVFHRVLTSRLESSYIAIKTRSVSSFLMELFSISSSFIGSIQIREPCRLCEHPESIRLDIPRSSIEYTPTEGGLQPPYGEFAHVF